ncbi:CHAT domain-containing protein [Multifurca ochricompacta]|uniref:CHAT domain-containing protein n=1 Tax=Multifurca ochricompacta TaxID=376703 RepID=A0AAD4M5V3_9AGAM|nr:CHAT domain-containing protein [Multifurca ochricompacta]
MQASRDTCFQALGRLSLCLFFRWLLFSVAQDLDELEIACKWASGSRVSGHHSTMSAYQNAMSLLQNCLVFAPTIETQHHRLVATRWMSRIPLEYASYLISVGRLEQAIEALEQGRALLWSEMRGLRTSIDQLREKKPELALRFAKVNQDLEALTTSISRSQSETVEVGEGAKDGEWFDAFGRTLNEQRKLLEERDGLISRIQELPGLQDFSKTLSYDALRDAASRGPVIIINHCKWRSDILILLHNSPPSFVPTPDDFYARATKLKDNLLETRNKYSPGSRKYDDALRSTLNDLYTLVGRPVIEKLRELKVPDQSRVWWCPTSVFCSLPLHAMGPIPSDDGVEQYFSDIYVSSYTPTLSALIQSRGPKVPTSDDPSLLLEINAIRTHLGQSAHCLVNEDATLEAVKEGLQRHRFAHFACHGNLEAGKPFDAWFKLEGDDRLTLLDIVRSHLPDAEFAFLSVCHAAELTDESIADEALHLAAAMQYCGFRSVVGTMWAVADDDGPELAKHFYRSMFGGEKAHSYKRSARSLRNAVQKLRRKREMTLERWVNFVHYGA